LQEKSGKKVGGQPGRKGNYRLQYDRPDEVVKHPVSACGHCGEDWTQTPVQKSNPKTSVGFARRNTVEGGGTSVKLVSPVEYGERPQALGVDWRNFHGIPYRRAAPKLEALLGVLLSVGTLEAAQTRIAERLKNAADCIYELLRRPNVLCANETGARAAGKN
jgi:hypothetical protein